MRPRFPLLVPAAWAMLAMSPLAVSAAGPRVELEVILPERAPVTSAQDWLAVLERAGLDRVRLRSARGGERVEVVASESGGATTYLVTGELTDRGLLRLPGGKSFSERDLRGLRDWVDALRADGPANLGAPRGAFGLTADQLVALHGELASPLPFSTQGKPARDVVSAILRDLPVPSRIDASAKSALAGDASVLDELRGVSSGTALAAALRPLGLVATPGKERGAEVTLTISSSRSAESAWPVGWPVEKSPREALPKLFEFLTIEISETSLNDALAALTAKLDAPVLYDHNGLARAGVDPAEISIELPRGRTFYKKAIDKVLSQGKLQGEIRLDEAGRAFYWITPVQK